METASPLRLQHWLPVVTVGFAVATVAAATGSASPFDEAVERYRPYLLEDISRAESGARTLRERLANRDLAGAKAAWIGARAGWERSEVFTTGFVPDLDREIDAWPDALKGFHAIEAKLFGAHSADALTETDLLISNLTNLGEKIRTIQLSPQRLLNGIARLAFEVGESKVEGGESRLSGTSLDDMRNNVDGIALAYRLIFERTFEAADAALAAAVRQHIEQLKALVRVRDLKHLDPDELRRASEGLVVILQNGAPRIGLQKPTLEERPDDQTP
jgi:iron uptake system component EfeO